MPPSQRAATLEGQIMRVADLIAYVNHDIDDAVRAGVLQESRSAATPRWRARAISSARIASDGQGRGHGDAGGGLAEIRMSETVLEATLAMRSFLFDAVYENEDATAEFKKATGILGGLWEKVRERPGRIPRPPHHRGRGAGRRHARFPRRHDGPLRGHALTSGSSFPSRGSGRWRGISYNRAVCLLRAKTRSPSPTLMLGRLHAARSHPLSPAGQSFRADVPARGSRRATRDAYQIVAPVELEFDIHKDKDKFRLVGRVRHGAGAFVQPLPRAVPVPDGRDVRPRYLPASAASAERGAGSRGRRSGNELLQ